MEPFVIVWRRTSNTCVTAIGCILLPSFCDCGAGEVWFVKQWRSGHRLRFVGSSFPWASAHGYSY